MKTIIVGSLLLLIALQFPVVGYSAVPQTINYQGHLASTGGSPVNVAVDMTFTIYNAATDGTNLWTEDQTVQVNNGIYAVALGATNPVDPAIIDGDLWLGVKVGVDAEMTPRQKLNSVPFAMNAGVAQSSASDGSFFIHWGDTSCPVGTELLYTGHAAYTQWNPYGASGALCLNVDNGPQGPAGGSSTIMPIKYPASISGIGALGALQGKDVPCAACVTSHSVTFMQPGNNICPTGTEALYAGYLMHLQDSGHICTESVTPSAYSTTDGNPWTYAGAGKDFGSGYYQDVISCGVCAK